VDEDLIDFGDDLVKGELPPSVTKGLLGTRERFAPDWEVNWILRPSDDNGLLPFASLDDRRLGEYAVGIEGMEALKGKNGECVADIVEATVSMEEDKTKGEIFCVRGDS
jgi:hypothetical protein